MKLEGTVGKQLRGRRVAVLHAADAFAMASAEGFDESIARYSLLNYGRLKFELGGGTFNESINVLNSYLERYPDSPYTADVKKLLIAAYDNAKNYDAAYSAIKTYNNPDGEIKRALQDNWDEAVTERKYVAVVNREQFPSGTIRSWLKENSAFIVYSSPKDNGGQLAITHYRVLGSNPKLKKSLVELELETGRKNQIRVQLSSIGHPITGDKKYGAKSNPIGRLALHADRLSFTHPISGEKIKLRTPLPGRFHIF